MPSTWSNSGGARDYLIPKLVDTNPRRKRKSTHGTWSRTDHSPRLKTSGTGSKWTTRIPYEYLKEVVDDLDSAAGYRCLRRYPAAHSDAYIPFIISQHAQLSAKQVGETLAAAGGGLAPFATRMAAIGGTTQSMQDASTGWAVAARRPATRALTHGTWHNFSGRRDAGCVLYIPDARDNPVQPSCKLL